MALRLTDVSYTYSIGAAGSGINVGTSTDKSTSAGTSRCRGTDKGKGTGVGKGTGGAQAVTALQGVSLSVEPGEMVLIAGATGSGKSTLLRLAAGLLECGSGQITLDGEALTPGLARGRVGLVFQDPESQLFAETLAEDVAFGPKNLGVAPDKAIALAHDVLKRVGLDPKQYAGRSPFSLSGGEARRAAIAGVLALAPDYLLADEPTVGLDSYGRARVRRVLDETRRSAGVLVVSHQLEEFLAKADRVVILAQGVIAWQGSSDEALSDPQLFLGNGLVPPEILEVQQLLIRRGLPLDGISLDPGVAATGVAAALESAGTRTDTNADASMNMDAGAGANTDAITDMIAIADGR
ncbi:MAG: ATP-binding cassette domain-containing protein [Coriobacteriia bacterium]|nr:ATP-binding cassette domain-containing protein [Coriobacteriia bacterium]